MNIGRVEGMNNLGNSYLNELGNEKYETKAFAGYQKLGKCCYENEIETKKVIYHVPVISDPGESEAYINRKKILPVQFYKEERNVKGCNKRSSNEIEVRKEELTEGHKTFEAACNTWVMKVESFKTQIKAPEDRNQKDSINKEDLNNACRSWVLRVKNHMNSKLGECIKMAQTNCAMGKDSNMNPKPKFNSEYYRKIGVVKRIMDDVEESYTKIGTSGVDSGEMKFLGGRLFIHNNLGDRGKRLDHPRNNLVHKGTMMIVDFGISNQIYEATLNSNSAIFEMPTYVEPQCLKDPGKRETPVNGTPK
ncbi:hypothetical protein C2G38_2163780 [Gigaspora rosea]|uniref:Protein kinase domain-containing protein n=1 Tax=Gigaspora rosea TaxID=44941 RepID=A0A397VWG4_9GLOM|nr:hypothetical protein C2G38_2163780 [Gigaspora rosea]